jgi:hypothetical protein
MSLGQSGMEAFQYMALPARVVFGFGTIAKVADELVALGRKRAFRSFRSASWYGGCGASHEGPRRVRRRAFDNRLLGSLAPGWEPC